MWITALILGFAGSLHCAGMCSPLALAITSMGSRSLRNKFVYNGGRIFTYAIMGALISVFGAAISFSGFQWLLTLSIAVTLIVMGFSGITGLRIPILTPLLIRFSSFIKTSFSSLLNRKTSGTMWVTGMLNGILPCGLTYLALTYCLTLEGALDGFQFMLLFGLGTFPAMFGLPSLIAYFSQRYNVRYAVLTRYAFVFIGLLVLARLYFAQHHMPMQDGDPLSIIFCR